MMQGFFLDIFLWEKCIVFFQKINQIVPNFNKKITRPLFQLLLFSFRALARF